MLNYIVKYELAIQGINSINLPQSHFASMYEKFHAEDITKLGELIGYPIGYTKALDVQRGKIMPSLKPKFRVFTNYRGVHDFIDSYTPTGFIKPSFDLSIHINKILMKGLIDDWDVAKIRGFSDKPNEIYDTWYKFRDFYPNLDAKRYFQDIFNWIEDPRVKINKLIQIAILLYEYIDKAPFSSGNQMSAMLAISAISKAYGYNPHNIIPYAKSTQFISEDIVSAMKIVKAKRDLTVFIEAFLYTLSLTAVNILNQYKEIYANKVKMNTKLQEQFNSRQMKILEYLEVERKVTRAEYTKIMGVSFMTAFRDLQELLDGDMIKQKGNGRGTYYTLHSKEKSSEISVE
ncbi:DeoR family transcriptional regulator [Candidatus Dojkabacteria bacterium]|jgi:Fic family protein|nr:DeoR family transcriptional regulator [Candidatus Dojkabacteria bacterium]